MKATSPGESAHPRPQRFSHRLSYAPWEFMLSVDKVNYNPIEQIQTSEQLSAPLSNIASGVSYYKAPKILLKEMVRAIYSPVFHQDYDGPQGNLAGIRAIQTCEFFRSSQRLELEDNEVMLTQGASMALYLITLYFAELHPGSEMLIPVPTFPLAGASAAFAGLQVKEVQHVGCNRFLPTPQELIHASTINTRLLFLNIYNNPSGETYSEDELAEILCWAKDAGVVIILDNVTVDMPLTREAPNVLEMAQRYDCRDSLVVVSSLSKDRSLPGLRIGWIIASLPIINGLSRYNALMSVSPPTHVGAALFVDMLGRTLHHKFSYVSSSCGEARSAAKGFVARATAGPLTPGLSEFFALYRDSTYLETLFNEYFTWHNDLMKLLHKNWCLISEKFGGSLLTGSPCHGGFNTFICVPSRDRVDSLQFTIDLFRQKGVLVLPRPCFESTANERQLETGFWTRVTFAMQTENLERGLRQLIQFAENYNSG